MVNCIDVILISISLHMLVQMFVKILFVGSRTSLVLVDTSSVSDTNPANPENESEGQSSHPMRRKRQCVPLNLTEPSLRRQVLQRCC